MRDEAIKNVSPVSYEDTKLNFVCQGQTAFFLKILFNPFYHGGLCGRD